MITSEPIQRGDEVNVIFNLSDGQQVQRGIVRSSDKSSIYVTGKGWGYGISHRSSCTEIQLIKRHGLMNCKSVLKLVDQIL